MIFSSIHAKQQSVMLPTAVEKALDFLKAHDFTKMEPGRYAIQGDDIYAQVFDAETKPAESTAPAETPAPAETQAPAPAETQAPGPAPTTAPTQAETKAPETAAPTQAGPGGPSGDNGGNIAVGPGA